MEGWQVRSTHGGQHFDFLGTGHVLAGGTQLTIWSGKDGKKHQEESTIADPANDHLFWCGRQAPSL